MCINMLLIITLILSPMGYLMEFIAFIPMKFNCIHFRNDWTKQHR